MMDREELNALADGELSAERTAELKLLLERDPEVRAEFEGIMALKQAVASRHIRHECRVEWLGCVGRLKELDKSRKVERVVNRYSWAMCGIFFIFILVGGIANRGASGSPFSTEDIVQTASNLMPTRTPPNKDRDALNAYLDALLGSASRSLAPDRLGLVSGATGTFNGHRAAHLILRDPSGDMALIVVEDDLNFDPMPSQDLGGIRLSLGRADNANLVAWHVPGGSAILIAERSYEDLASVAQRISLQ